MPSCAARKVSAGLGHRADFDTSFALQELIWVRAEHTHRVYAQSMSLIDDPAHWRSRASDVRRLANASQDPVHRTKLQKIAASYDVLAFRALARLASGRI